jgi:ppGpp synthetase/RelA/SpoT-type nucleotidyltranferase
MEWKKPEHDKKTVRKAGKAVAKRDFSKIGEDLAYKVINNWRSAHAYPLQALYLLGKRYAEKHDGVIVVQRLKRLESIMAKLIRFPAMGLETMQDLGGCRVIVPDISGVDAAVAEYENARANCRLIKVNNYIAKPKSDGYRSVHLVYEYDGSETEYAGLRLEAQIRTALQHSWATAVESLGLRKNVNIKAGEGDAGTREYMRLVSALFAIEENAPIGAGLPSDVSEIFRRAKRLEITSNALNIIRAVQMLPTFSGGRENARDYYVIRVETETGEAKVYSYDDSQFEAAADFCLEVEKANNDAFAVLVSAADANELLKAYPNYLSDAKLFVDKVDEINGKYGEL